MALVESLSGIRGIFDKDLTESVALRYAYAYYSFLKNKTKKNSVTLVIGRDTRPSGASLAANIIGMLDCNILDVGIAPTPVVEFAVRHFNADGGIIITASHNEPYWNGFKFLGSDGAILNEKEMAQVIKNFKIASFEGFHKIGERKIYERNGLAIKEYFEFIKDTLGRDNLKEIKASKQKIVIDPNGGTGAISKEILESLGVDVVGANMAYGQFNRTVEPTEDSLIYLKNTIDENKADFAAGFDCDSDRIEILLNNGSLLSGNYILALIVDSILSNHPNPKGKFVVVNDATSIVVKKVAEKYGARLKEVQAGETNIVEEMRTSKAVVGGEGSSGGAIIPESKCRDGILTLLAVISIIARKKKKLEDLIKDFPLYYNLRKKIEFGQTEHDKIKKSLRNYYSKKSLETRENDIKGSLKVISGKDSFIWFRSSRTEGNVFRIIAESNNKEEAERLLDEATRAFENAAKGN